MRVLITGARGFVGPYVAKAIAQVFGQDAEVLRSSISRATHNYEDLYDLDVTDIQSVLRQLEHLRPTHVVHLAGLAAVPVAAANAEVAWHINLLGTLNIAQAILQTVPTCVLLYIGSGQVYGASAKDNCPLTEKSLLAPTNPYEASKAAADLAIGAMASSGLHAIRIRPFNHTGPGQSDQFVVPSLAMQIARIKIGQQQPIVRVGNLAAERDFLDVRDVANAYALALKHSHHIEPGTILNISSGSGTSINSILTRLIQFAGREIEVCSDATRFRNVDIPRFVGDSTLARTLLGWRPIFSLDDTLKDVLLHCERAIREP